MIKFELEAERINGIDSVEDYNIALQGRAVVFFQRKKNQLFAVKERFLGLLQPDRSFRGIVFRYENERIDCVGAVEKDKLQICFAGTWSISKVKK